MKKLELKKETVTNLSKTEMNDVTAGYVWAACWENLWTAYHCGVFCTGGSFDPKEE